MIKEKNVIVVDIDNTLTLPKGESENYSNIKASIQFKTKLDEFKSMGYWIILYTSRNMRTYNGNIGLIMKNTAPVLIDWLAANEIPYDEIHFGKPWCGDNGFYIDDRAIRPREFLNHSHEEILKILERDKVVK
jgi:capsule biosynthesis phosphatase